MGREKVKCVYNKLNVVDFQCKHKEKYTLNVNKIQATFAYNAQEVKVVFLK